MLANGALGETAMQSLLTGKVNGTHYNTNITRSLLQLLLVFAFNLVFSGQNLKYTDLFGCIFTMFGHLNEKILCDYCSYISLTLRTQNGSASLSSWSFCKK